jgi:NitT/TauT family transport system substrate-binding protein
MTAHAARFGALLLALILLPAHDARAADLTAVRIGVLSSITETPFYIADRLGYFRDEGLSVTFVPFDSAANMIVPLGTGQLDAGGGAISAGLYNAVGRGIDVRITADLGSDPPGYGFVPLLVRSDLVKSGQFKSPRDLRGMRIALTAAGISTSAALDQLLRSAGLGPADVHLVTLSNPDQVIALKNGSIDATLMPEPNATLAVRSGVAVRIEGNDKFYPNQESAAVYYGTTFLRKRRDLGAAFMRAYLRAARFYNDSIHNGAIEGPNVAQLVDILGVETGIADKSVLRAMTPNGSSADGAVNLPSMRSDFAYFQGLHLIEGTVTPESAIDSAFVTDAVAQLGPYRPQRAKANAR